MFVRCVPVCQRVYGFRLLSAQVSRVHPVFVVCVVHFRDTHNIDVIVEICYDAQVTAQFATAAAESSSLPRLQKSLATLGHICGTICHLYWSHTRIERRLMS